MFDFTMTGRDQDGDETFVVCAETTVNMATIYITVDEDETTTIDLSKKELNELIAHLQELQAKMA